MSKIPSSSHITKSKKAEALREANHKVKIEGMGGQINPYKVTFLKM